MSAAKLIGLAASAAHHAASARGNADALAAAHDALDDAFHDLDADEAQALGEAAGVLLERHARETGDWLPWAQIWWNARLPALRDAAAGFRARLDAKANSHREWERRQQQVEAERAEAGLRRAVRPLMRLRVPKAKVEEVAGPFAELLGWPRTFEILVDEFDAARRPEMSHG